MPKKRFSAEQIVTLLRQIEVLMAQGKATPVACRDAGISQQSYYRWRKEYGGLEIDQAKRMPRNMWSYSTPTDQFGAKPNSMPAPITPPQRVSLAWSMSTFVVMK